MCLASRSPTHRRPKGLWTRIGARCDLIPAQGRVLGERCWARGRTPGRLRPGQRHLGSVVRGHRVPPPRGRGGARIGALTVPRSARRSLQRGRGRRRAPWKDARSAHLGSARGPDRLVVARASVFRVALPPAAKEDGCDDEYHAEGALRGDGRLQWCRGRRHQSEHKRSRGQFLKNPIFASC